MLLPAHPQSDRSAGDSASQDAGDTCSADRLASKESLTTKGGASEISLDAAICVHALVRFQRKMNCSKAVPKQECNRCTIMVPVLFSRFNFIHLEDLRLSVPPTNHLAKEIDG